MGQRKGYLESVRAGAAEQVFDQDQIRRHPTQSSSMSDRLVQPFISAMAGIDPENAILPACGMNCIIGQIDPARESPLRRLVLTVYRHGRMRTRSAEVRGPLARLIFIRSRIHHN